MYTVTLTNSLAVHELGELRDDEQEVHCSKALHQLCGGIDLSKSIHTKSKLNPIETSL